MYKGKCKKQKTAGDWVRTQHLEHNIEMPKPLCQQHCSDTRHSNNIYICCCTWRLVTNLLRWTGRPTRPRHDIAWPSLNVDLFIAEVGGEAGLGGADHVAAHCGPMEP